MVDRVWLCNVYRNGDASRGYRPVGAVAQTRDLQQNHINRAFVELCNKLNRHEPVADADFPAELYAAPPFRAHKRPKRHLFVGGGPFVVSSEAADVLRAHNLGATRLLPVTLLFPNGATRVEGDWFYLVVRDQKAALRANVSTGLHKFSNVDVFMPLGKDQLKADNVVVSPNALDGPDIWFDPAIYLAVFLSEKLKRALTVAKVAKHWDLVACKVEAV